MGYKSYHTSVKTSFALGIEMDLLPASFIDSLPHSTTDGWKNTPANKFVGQEYADDRIANSLILNSNVLFFELRPREFINIQMDDPTIAVRKETFGEGNGYVGITASKDIEYCKELYTEMLEYWVEHIKFGLTDYYSDLNSEEDLDDLIKQIEELKEVFEENNSKDFLLF